MASLSISSRNPHVPPFLFTSPSSKITMFASSSLSLQTSFSVSHSFGKRNILVCMRKQDKKLAYQKSPRKFPHMFKGEAEIKSCISKNQEEYLWNLQLSEDIKNCNKLLPWKSALSAGAAGWLCSAQVAHSSEVIAVNMVYETGELFELGIQLSYLLILLGFLGVGSFFVIRQVLVRRELDLSAKELQEQVRSGSASATALFELGAVMLRRKFYPAATKYLQEAIDKWDGDSQDLAQRR